MRWRSYKILNINIFRLLTFPTTVSWFSTGEAVYNSILLSSDSMNRLGLPGWLILVRSA